MKDKKLSKKWLIQIIGIAVVAVIILLVLVLGLNKFGNGDEGTSSSPENVITDLVEERSLILSKDDSKQLTVAEGETLSFSSSDASVVTVDEKGLVKAVSVGNAMITISNEKSTSYCGVIVTDNANMVDVTKMKAEIVFSDIMLHAQTEITGMAYDSVSNAFYFSQSYGPSVYEPLFSDIIVSEVKKTESGDGAWGLGSYMNFYESGEGHLGLENKDGKTYLWLESNGSYLGSGTTVSHVEWEDEAFCQETYGDTFSLDGVQDTLQPTLDAKNDLVMVYDNDTKEYLIYDRSDLLEGKNPAYLHKVKCAKGQEAVAGADDSQNHYNISICGFALSDGYIYQLSGRSSIYVSVFDLEGKLQYCHKLTDYTDMDTRIPAGIVVEDGIAYIGIQSGSESFYFANVWKYESK